MKFKTKIEQRRVEERLARQHLTLWELTDKAREIRSIYARIRQEYYPSYRMRGDPDLNIWERVALHMLENNVSPELYIGLAFHYIGSDTLPNHLLASKMQEQYVKRTEDSKKRAEHEISQSTATIKCLMKGFPKMKLRTLLVDPMHGFSALFIWALASELGLTETADEYASKVKTIKLRDPIRVAVFEAQFHRDNADALKET